MCGRRLRILVIGIVLPSQLKKRVTTQFRIDTGPVIIIISLCQSVEGRIDDRHEFVLDELRVVAVRRRPKVPAE